MRLCMCTYMYPYTCPYMCPDASTSLHVSSYVSLMCLCMPVLAVWVWGNAEKVLRETPPSCSNLPTKSFPFSEKVFMPALRHAELASLIFGPGYGQYGVPPLLPFTHKSS